MSDKTGTGNTQQGIPDIKKVQLHWLLQITKAINYNLPSAQLFEIYHNVIRDHLKIGKLLLLIHEEVWHIPVHYGLEPEGPVPAPENLLNLIPVYSENPGGSSGWMHQFETIIPVTHNDKNLAYAFVGGLEDNIFHSKREITTYLHTITNVIAVAIENQRMTKESIRQAAVEKELELAAQMQSMLIPSGSISHPIFDMAATYIPHQSVGGDYCDFVELNEDEVLICMADVSGKGLSAALLMSNFQANLHALIRHTDFSLDQLVIELNECVNRVAQGEKFVTFFVARINHGNKTIEYINAGHNPPMLIMENDVTILDKGTTGLGMFEELPFLYHGISPFPEQAMLFCYTDGITELENMHGSVFGTENLSGILKTHPSAADLNEFHLHVVKALDKFRGSVPYTDDVTFLSLRYTL